MTDDPGLDVPDDGDRPATFRRITDRYPDIARAHSSMGQALDDAGPLDRKTLHLIKLGVCVGAGLESATKSHTRRALEQGATPGEIEHAVLQGMNTVGFSRTVMAWVWATEQMDAEG